MLMLNTQHTYMLYTQYTYIQEQRQYTRPLHIKMAQLELMASLHIWMMD